MLEYIPQNWQEALNNPPENNGWRDNIESLNDFLQTELNEDRNYHPTGRDIFDAFHKTSFDNVRVVIIGQSPYLNPDHAKGLAFFAGEHPTPSLVNINHAIQNNDVGDGNLTNDCLKRWAEEEGILLLNSALTFFNDADRHKNIGWAQFIQAVVTALAYSERAIHFMLWGTEAYRFEGATNAPPCRLHKTYLPAQQQQNYVQEFLNSRQFFDVNKEIRDSPRNEEEINWFPPE